MALKVQNAGLFTIPTGPSAGTVVAQSGSANTYGTFVTLQASGVLGASYLTGVSATVVSSLHTGQYVNVQVATGASGSESVVGAVQIPTPGPAATTGIKYGGFSGFADLPIAVAANTRIACKTASDTASGLSWNVSLQGLLQANEAVDTTQNETVNVIQVNGTNQTARDLGASVLLSSGTGTGQVTLNSGAVTVGTNNDKTGYSLTQTFPANFATLSIDGSGRVDVIKINGTSQTARDIGASVLLSSGTGTGQVSLNAGHISNVDTLTTYTGNTVQTGDSFARLGVAGVGLTNLGDTRIANLDAAISTRSTYGGTDTSGTSTLLTRLSNTRATNLDNLDAAISTRSTYGGSDTSGTTTLLTRLSSDRAVNLDSITTIKTKTDSLTFTVANQADVNITSVNSVTVSGTGSSSNPWGP